MSTESEPLEKPPISVWRRVGCGLGGLVLILAVFGVARYLHEQTRTTKTLAERVAALDASDPNWQLRPLIDSRPMPPAGSNSAEVIQRIKALVPKGHPRTVVDEQLQDVELGELLTAEQMKLLDEEVKILDAAIREARRLEGLLEGRYDLTIDPDNPLNTVLQDQQEARQAANVLRLDAWHQAMQGEIDGAMRSSRATVNAGRSLVTDPFAISHLIRLACVAVGLSSMERTLGLGEASDAELVRVQQLLRKEDSSADLRVVLFGERALSHATMQGLVAGKIPAKPFLGGGGGKLGWMEQIFGLSRSHLRRQQIVLLDLFGEMLEATKLAEDEQPRRLKEIEAKVRPSDSLVRLMLPAMLRMQEAFSRGHAQLRCMEVLLGVERYRMWTGKWPERLEDIPREMLERVPNDPFDGKPIRYRRVADGVVVYSVGQNGVDDGGVVTRSPTGGLSPDLGWRLWDVAKRRQPPRPPVARPEGNPPGQPGGPGVP